MSEGIVKADKSSKSGHRRKWLRIVAAIPLLLIVGYLVVGSSAFFTAVILPQVGKALGGKVTVGHAAISPFSRVVLKQLEIRTVGPEPLLTAEEVRLQYNLRDIIRGKTTVSELAVVSPVVRVVYNADGTSNLDPVLTHRAQKTPKEPKPKPNKPSQLDFKNLAVKNATVRLVKNLTGGGRETIEVVNADFALSQLANGRPGSLNVSSDLKYERKTDTTNDPSSVAARALHSEPEGGLRRVDLLQGRITGEYDFDLLPDLRPQNLKGAAKLQVVKADGAMKEFAALRATIEVEVTPQEIKQAALRFAQSGKNLGEISLSGPFNAAKREGKLRLEVGSIDRQVLNLFGATRGLDFGPVTITSTNEIELGQSGSFMVAKGHFTTTQFSVTKGTHTTPPLDLSLNYLTTVDRQKQSALIEKLALTGTQNQKPLLTGSLNRPMKLVWAKTRDLMGESTFRLDLTKLNLADWRPLLGDYAGIISLNLNVLQSVKQLRFDVAAQVEGLQAPFGTNKITISAIELQASGQMDEFKQAKLNPSRLQIGPRDLPASVFTVSGQFDQATNATVEITGDATLSRFAPFLPPDVFNASNGTVKMKAQYSQKGKLQKANGEIVLAGFTGSYGNYRFEDYGVTLKGDAEIKDEKATLRTLKGAFQEGAQSGGALDASGDWNLTKKTGQLDFKTMNLNERAVRPFLEALLADKKLASATIAATATARCDTRGESTLKGDFQVTKLTVVDPNKQLSNAPLEAKLQIDGAWRNQVLGLRQFQVTLSPTARAKNEIRLTGNLDWTKPNAIAGQLKLASDAVDLTPYYDLFAGSPTNTATAKPPPTEVVASSANAEPPAKNLPFRTLNFDVNLARFYLHDIVITNWQANAGMDGARIVLKPCTLTLNGAPVNLTADLNLGVPGYQYDFTFRGAKIPIEPIANTFSPDYRDKAKGDLIASIQIKGAGTTGASLRNSLTGQVDLVFTNANIQLVGRKAKLLITPIAFVLRLNELTKSPVNWVSANVKLGEGKINLAQANVVSQAFMADTHGEIPIAPVFTNSPLNNLPVNFALRRAVAEKANLMAQDTPSDAEYVQLPSFVKIAGTIGHPDAKTDARVIAGLLGRSAIGLTRDVGKAMPGVTDEANKFLQGLNKVLAGDKSSSTNQPATNKPAKFNPLDLFKKKKE